MSRAHTERRAAEGSMPTVSMKDALRHRPGSPEGHSRTGGGGQVTVPGSRQPRASAAVTCSPFWTESEFRTFRYLTDMVYTGCAAGVKADPRSRADAAVYLKRFTDQQGKEKCDMMLAELRRLDATAWFNDKRRQS